MFLRPEAVAALKRWGEVIAGGVIMALGLWTLAGSGWVMQATGAGLLLLGAAMAFAAWRRAKFSGFTGGPGVVEVDERQISYFGAYEGGAVSLEMLARVTMLNDNRGQPVWLFEEDGGQSLSIPAAAAGADQIYDALSALPGLDYEAANRAMRAGSNESFVIWAKPHTRLH
ncbi:MAG: hypothetical protein JXR14_13450 [Paracoccaceae bacterium]